MDCSLLTVFQYCGAGLLPGRAARESMLRMLVLRKMALRLAWRLLFKSKLQSYR